MKRGLIYPTPGYTMRVIASAIIALSLPFLAVTPQNVYAQGVFAFGNFLLAISVNVK